MKHEVRQHVKEGEKIEGSVVGHSLEQILFT